MLRSDLAAVVSQRGHLKDLEAELDRALVVAPEDVPHDVVTMNSTVILQDLKTGEIETYTLVYPDRADILNNQLSVLAPVGTAVLGQRVGDVLRWRVPAGWRQLKIEQVVYQPEREGAFHL
jgi:regulator of nucleoside diphosphate kinase